jgi:hypothetical protein
MIGMEVGVRLGQLVICWPALISDKQSLKITIASKSDPKDKISFFGHSNPRSYRVSPLIQGHAATGVGHDAPGRVTLSSTIKLCSERNRGTRSRDANCPGYSFV